MNQETEDAIVAFLRNQNAGFQWISLTLGRSVSRDELVEAIQQRTEIGKTFLALAESFGMDPDMVFKNDVPNALGKRQTCIECGAQVLVTKAGAGKVHCCERMMEIVEPKPLPSAD